MIARKLASACLTLLSLLSCAARISAQAPLDPAQMPSRTLFYFLWRGLPPAEARKSNALLSLSDDPDFAPLRTSFLAAIASSEKDEAKKQLARQSFADFGTLLENPFVIGYLRSPDSDAAVPSAKKNGLFFVYDRTGKEALLSKTVLALGSGSQASPHISQITVADAPALKIETKNGTTYWAESGKYAVGARDPAVFEQILKIVVKKIAPESTLAASSEYREAQPLVGGGLFEFFLRIPHTQDFAAEISAKGMKIQPALEALKLDSLHSIVARATVDGPRTRLEGAILGDNSPSTLFDVWGQNSSAPASLAFVSANTVSYNTGQINLLGIYEIAKRVMGMYMPPGQGGGPALLETMAQARLGISISDALGLFSGEFASLQNSPSLDARSQVYYLKITKKPELLKLFHAILAGRISSEKTENDITFMKISVSGPEAAALPPTFYHLALSPDSLLVSPSNETLRELLAERKLPAVGAEFAGLPKFQAARAEFPANLTSLSFLDFQKLDWPALKARWIADAQVASQLNKERAKTDPTGKAPANVNKIPDWLAAADPQLFSHHLHYMSGASWKDSKGLHFDEWIE